MSESIPDFPSQAEGDVGDDDLTSDSGSTDAAPEQDDEVDVEDLP
jgi:hypothetical protein